MSDLNKNIGLEQSTSTSNKVAAYVPLVTSALPSIACLIDKNACPQPATTTNVTNITADPNKSSGLSTGAIIGIVAGGFVFLILIVVVIIVATKK